MEKPSTFPMTGTTEQKLGTLLMVATMAYGFIGADQVKSSRLKEIATATKSQRTPSAEKFQDHPVASWFLTNATVWSLVTVQYKILGELKPKGPFWKNFIRYTLANMIMVDGAMAMNWLYINKLYSHVPFFSQKRVKQTPWEVFTDYMKCNFIVYIITSLGQVALYHRDVARLGRAPSTSVGQPFRPLRFLARLAWQRVSIDIFFWAGHYILHNKRVYSWGHRTHHEHSSTQLTTNYHFDWYDLLTEAYIPFLIGKMSYEAAFGPIEPFDLALLGCYAFWHEIESHAGKPMPTMPLLAPLSTWTQKLDDFNSWFHEVHHRTLKCNYSITPWFDQLVGTDRWDL
mmetsp:Transcript_11378/g.22241  ORF Transcript_11378/g.22241 Transcript_11378/m.22241 type:complete len:343 (-) Transcript_11378:183-1211(-)